MTRWIAVTVAAVVIVPPMLMALACIWLAEHYDNDWSGTGYRQATTANGGAMTNQGNDA